MPDLSVLIPTHARPDKLADCCRALAAQSLDPDRFEVLIGIDGPDTGEQAVAIRTLPQARVEAFPKAGPGAVRNRLLQQASGRVVLFLNDDVTPEQGCLAAHLDAHDELDRAGQPAIVLGDAPWRIQEPDRLFDRLIRSTSMVFFYDRMDASDPMKDWGFRHAWTLNLSVPREVATAVPGGAAFDESLPAPCYEDLEWAWRITGAHALPVLFRPEARVVHDHRYEPSGYLERERRMGAEAFRLSRVAPECAKVIFGRDVSTPEEVRYAREAVQRESRDMLRLERSFLELADLPASALGEGLTGDRLINLLYEQHLPVKRWYWRQGLVEAASAEATAAA